MSISPTALYFIFYPMRDRAPLSDIEYFRLAGGYIAPIKQLDANFKPAVSFALFAPQRESSNPAVALVSRL